MGHVIQYTRSMIYFVLQANKYNYTVLNTLKYIGIKRRHYLQDIGTCKYKSNVFS